MSQQNFTIFKKLGGEVSVVGQIRFMPSCMTFEGESTQHNEISTNRSGYQGRGAARSLGYLPTDEWRGLRGQQAQQQRSWAGKEVLPPPLQLEKFLLSLSVSIKRDAEHDPLRCW